MTSDQPNSDLKNIVESLLFVADSPLDINAFKKVIPDTDAKELRAVLAELIAEYEARQGGFQLYEVAGGYQFRTRPDYKEWVKRLVRPAPVRLSKAALETLAIIAYHQPVIRSDVEHIRGVDSGAIIRTLLERKLIRILGKKEIPGRPLIYATTKRFLEVFNLRSLSDMPSLKEIQEFGRTHLAEEPEAGEEGAAEASPESAEATEEGAADPPEAASEPPETEPDAADTAPPAAADLPGEEDPDDAGTAPPEAVQITAQDDPESIEEEPAASPDNQPDASADVSADAGDPDDAAENPVGEPQPPDEDNRQY